MTKRRPDFSKLKLESKLAHAGRDATRAEGSVNPPIHRATTLILDTVDDLYDKPVKTYALEGMAVQEALAEALVAVEGGAGAVLTQSGLGACTVAILTVARSGKELLVTDSVYRPTRRFCDRLARQLGVAVRYYDPRIGAAIAELISDNTCGIVLESPGSLTFEVQDVPAIAAAARARSVPTIIDNTWSAGIYLDPFAHGVDFSVQALTKYQAGHADAFMGAVLAREPTQVAQVRSTAKDLGLGASPDDAYLVLRGLRSMGVRLERQAQSALTIARWLEGRAQVARVLHPALPSHPDHALWRRDFTGASGLFGVVLKPFPGDRLTAMLEGLSLFAMGFSWGGYESLIVPCDPQIMRSASEWRAEGPLLRLSVGLEHPDDLIVDLEAGFARLKG